MKDNERKHARGGGGARPIGAFTARTLDPIARARGFATTAILSDWPAVVGAELAAFTMPDRLVWPRRTEDAEEGNTQSTWRAEGAVLVLRVDGPRGIELQHRADQILDRINTYFGYRAVAQLRFLQAPVQREKRFPSDLPATEEVAPISGISDSGLSQALGKLAAGVKSPKQPV
jgi:hypothetical protein